MGLQDTLNQMTLAHRDVPISLKAALVMKREAALEAVVAAEREHRTASIALREAETAGDADQRLGQAASFPELEARLADAHEALNAAVVHAGEIEAEMRADIDTFRVKAMPKDAFEELQIAAEGNAKRAYSMYARQNITYLNPDGSEDEITDAQWDQLEANMVEGQWAPIRNAIDELNISAGRPGHGFRDWVASNPGLREELAAARELGISPRRFWGWEPTTVVRTENLADGTRIEHHRPEPEWDDTQRGLMIAYLAWQRRIGRHGHPVDETTSPLADPANPDAEWRYYADPEPIVDWAERVRTAAEDAYRERLPEGESMAGLIFTVDKIPLDPNRSRL